MRTIIKTPTLKSLFDSSVILPTAFEFMTDDYFGNVRNKSIPAVNVNETNENLTLDFCLPGFTKNELKIDVEQNVLTVSAENKEEVSKSENNFIRKEFIRHSFSRSFTLPENLDADLLNAKYENGILTVAIPKKELTKVESKKVFEIV